MNARVVGLAVVIAAFGALTVEALLEVGYVGLFQTQLVSFAGLQVLVDLTLSLVIVLGFIQRDARERGLPFAPYVVATLLTGSFGPLAYLVHRELAGSRAARPTALRQEVRS
jgi:hypothetical protein